jgi:NAD(P)-dependent dehydrogenase (short-subunit alcohol dehydrogenase family)
MQASGLAVDGIAADVSVEAQVQAGIEAVSAKHGKLDILINCAGIVGACNCFLQ